MTIDGFFYRLPSYERVAQTLGVSLDTIHWNPATRFRRAGLRRLLVEIWTYRAVSGGEDVPSHWDWWAIWQANVWAYRTARQIFHVTLPARLSAKDRARVEAILTGWQLDGIESTLEIRAALAWARRR